MKKIKKNPRCPLERKKTELKNRILILESRMDREGRSPLSAAAAYATELEMRRLREFLRELQDGEGAEEAEISLRSVH